MTASITSSVGDKGAIIKKALVELRESKARIETLENAYREPIAIIGMGCRFPGEVEDPKAFWHLLKRGGDAIIEVPRSRWNIDKYYNSKPQTPAKIISRYGGFLSQVDSFDAPFFSISPREAISLDPQQRLLLEVAWEALEQAQIPPQQLLKSLTGVFVGIGGSDYSNLIYKAQMLDAYVGTGNAHSTAAGRLSYVLGLTGPCLAINTACSSSLVAVHLACQSLRQQECHLALAAGVNLLLSPETSIVFSQAGMLALDGHCKTFDAKADGYVRSEGCGTIILKRLSDAQRDGDPILAVIRGSAVNQDGFSGGLTVPNGLSQEAVIQQALKNSRVKPGQVSYIEAHGTGTSLGDPIEVGALTNVFGNNHSKQSPLIVGSVKTNIGHTECAAGMAGLIKVVLQLQHQEIVPHLHFKQPNPYILWSEIPIEVPTQSLPWTATKGTQRIAGISSFGFSGTNAHVILEEAPVEVQREVANVKQTRESERSHHLLAFSAKTEAALRDLIARYRKHLQTHSKLNLGDICYTANVGRSHFTHRLSITTTSLVDLQAKLTGLQQNEEVTGCCRGVISTASTPPKIVFLFTGQGSQYKRMGRQLYETQPTFRKALDQCNEILQAYLDTPLLEILYANDNSHPKLHQTVYTQPALFALEYALYHLWRSWGIQPAVMIGHSVGEYVAACVAEVFSLEDGLKLIAARGRLMQNLPPGGMMAAIMTSEEEVKQMISPYSGQVAIAAINSPQNTVISGEANLLQSICRRFEAQGVKVTLLQVSHAFHSPLMEPMLTEFNQIAQQMNYSPPRLRLISNVTGHLATADIATPEYWCQHILAPVKFAIGMETLHQQDCDIFLECGPKPVLLAMGQQCLPEGVGVWLPSLRPGQDDWQQMVISLSQMYVRGTKIDWVGFDRDYSQRRKVPLPTYPFQRQRYWVEIPPSSHSFRSISDDLAPTHPLLGHQLPLAGSQLYFESLLSQNHPDYLTDHRVFNQALLPATAYLEMALAIGHHLFPQQFFSIEEVQMIRGLVLPDSETIRVQTIVSPQDKDTYCFEIFGLSSPIESSLEPQWQLYSQGILRCLAQGSSASVGSLSHYQAECSQPCEVKAHYYHFQQCHIDYGPSFQGLQQLWKGTHKVLGRIQLPETLIGNSSDYCIHPALLDAALQVLMALNTDLKSTTYLPVVVKRFEVYRPTGVEIWSLGEWKFESNTSVLTTQVTLMDGAGELIACLEGLCLRAATSEALLGRKQDTLQNWLYEVEWRAQGRFGRLEPPLFIPDVNEVATYLQAYIQKYLMDNPELSHYLWELLPQLEQASWDFILQALIQLGWTYEIGDSISFAEVTQRLRIVPQHQRLLSRLLEILSEKGVIKPQVEQWQVLQSLSTLDCPTDSISPALANSAEWQILQQCGSQLNAVLCGMADPIQLMFPGGDLSMAAQLYQDSPGAQALNTLIQQVITTTVASLPQHRGLRVLEIGAGTGSTTFYILPHLPAERTQYYFTDIGMLFLQKAQERFEKYQFVKYQILDIEKDPSTQGFTDHQQDVVIAANVLHSTQDLKQTLTHARQLLAPRGLLVILEGTRQQQWLDLTFGLLEGWWRFTDVDLRPDYPLLNGEQWQQLLQESGFSSVEVLPKLEVGAEIGQVVIIAQADGGSEKKSHPEPGGWLILADQEGVAHHVAECLQEHEEMCIVVTLGQQTQLQESEVLTLTMQDGEGYQQLLKNIKTKVSTLKGVIHCWGLDGSETQEMDAQALEEASQLGCGTVLLLMQALVQISGSTSPRLWIVTQGTQPAGSGEATLSGISQSPLWGMGKVIMLEHPELQCICIDLDPSMSVAERAANLWAEVWSGNQENQVALRQEERYVARLAHCSQLRVPQAQLSTNIPEESCRLELTRRGILDSLQWVPAPRQVPGPREVEIKVQATGLNFLDIIAALDLIPQQVNGRSQEHLRDVCTLGEECAGIIVALGEEVDTLSLGDSVIALATGAFSQYVVVDASYVVVKPDNFSFEQAAAIPVNFLTVYYALCEVAHLKAGDRVLIHAATGGTGMAAVQIAMEIGAEVFATASPAKWEVLQTMGVKHIMNSRTTEFAEQIMALTTGLGVDVVLNSLTSEDFIACSLSALGSHGRFVEIAKRGVWSSEQMAQERPDVAYTIVDLIHLSLNQPELIQSLLQRTQEKFQKNQWQPPCLTVFSSAQVIDAFRYMQRAQHTGKIVVTQQPQSKADVILSEEGTYLITGGLGGLGLVLAEWLLEHQAKHLVLLSRHGPNLQAQTQLKALEERGAQVVVVQADVADYDAMKAVIDSIRQSPFPLKGIIHAAGVLQDAVLQRQTWQKFVDVMRPKVQGAWNLHQLTQSAPVEFFVMFSSVASLLGSPGQANHSAANAFLDGLAYYRQSLGLPGQSFNLGAVTHVGKAAERKDDIRMQQWGIGMIHPQQMLKVLEQLLQQPEVTEVGLLAADWVSKQQPSQWLDWPYLSDWTVNRKKEAVLAQESEFLQQLRTVSAAEQKKMLTVYIKKQVAQTLGIADWQGINDTQSFFDLGLDSLMAVELRNQLQFTFQQSLSPTLLFTLQTIEALVEFLTQENLSQQTKSSESGQEEISQYNKVENPDKAQNSTTAQNSFSLSVLDLEAEAILDATIQISSKPTVQITKTKSVLLTGATGFLGAFLLNELLHQTDANIYCLVRATDIEVGQRKIQENLKLYRLWNAEHDERVIPIVGDISKSQLGLSASVFENLADYIDAIYHSAAFLNFIYPYANLKPTNVIGTQEIIRLASSVKPKPLHYVSTTAVFGSKAYRGEIVTEVDSLTHSKSIYLGYVQSKWVAEKLVQNARDQGLPVCIYRPGLISGSSISGAWNINDVICRFFKGCIQMGSYPDLDSLFDISPVDYVAQAIILLSQNPDMLGRTFHLQHPDPIHWSHVMNWIRRLGYSMEPASYDQWVESLSSNSTSSTENALSTLAPFFATRFAPEGLTIPELSQLRESPKISCQETVRTLAQISNIKCPAYSLQLFQIYFSYFVDCGFL